MWLLGTAGRCSAKSHVVHRGAAINDKGATIAPPCTWRGGDRYPGNQCASESFISRAELSVSAAKIGHGGITGGVSRWKAMSSSGANCPRLPRKKPWLAPAVGPSKARTLSVVFHAVPAKSKGAFAMFLINESASLKFSLFCRAHRDSQAVNSAFAL